MTVPEFSRPFDRRQITDKPVTLSAGEAEMAALAERFGLVAVKRLEVELRLQPEGEAVDVAGTLSADIVQSCAISGDDLPAKIEEEIAFRFVPDRIIEDKEIELEEEDLDEIPYSGTSFDLGEAMAQSLALAIDPYATGPNADEARKEAGLVNAEPQGKMAQALAAALKKD
ncbi:uncharacterized metal-binding protein YceD (DUF177 family) [Altererythrobacter atlanticus]|uniref:Uncharacterized protein n=1 Tax=Croceibacterium atlanticum TaxID=1267766 RepID=A0A0F7KUF7_9SPHN|nr:YceD family protein [Croceibacterium atlanticum]AKH43978.1 hypothetical protein WYH_02952 [Croceibacterium atlanticum]MBB5732283.1 uncharacterized metal-binding protein YceD (DUF177 family) [Croceibacterium atlanticum]